MLPKCHLLPRVSGSFMFWESCAFEKGILCSLPSIVKGHFEVIRKLTKVFSFNSCKAKTGNASICIILIEKKTFLMCVLY